MENAARQIVGASSSISAVPLNFVLHQTDVNNAEYGLQSFIYKTYVDAGVNATQGGIVGGTNVAGFTTVTPDFSDVAARNCTGRLGGVSTIAVTAGTTAYGWVQFEGISRYAINAGSGGTVTAGQFQVWSDDDTLTDVGATNEEDILGFAAVTKTGANVIAAGNFMLGK